MRRISLTRGKFALVDNQDYEFLTQWKWCASKGAKTFYARRGIKRNGKRTTISMHRVLSTLISFKLANCIDHVNRNGLDNRRKNLRPVTKKRDLENRGKFRNNTSGYTGISWNRQWSKWKAYIGHHGKVVYLGYFDRLQDAVKARKNAEQKCNKVH